jgi:hypothetical protein
VVTTGVFTEVTTEVPVGMMVDTSPFESVVTTEVPATEVVLPSAEVPGITVEI